MQISVIDSAGWAEEIKLEDRLMGWWSTHLDSIIRELWNERGQWWRATPNEHEPKKKLWKKWSRHAFDNSGKKTRQEPEQQRNEMNMLVARART